MGDPVKTPLPHISGSDVGGTVVEVGPDVQKIKVGDRVVSHSNMSCRVCYECTSGREYDCSERTIWGFQTGPLWGGFAQYTHLPEVNVVKIADNVSFNDAGAVSMVGMTSWHMLVRRGQDQAGPAGAYHGRRFWRRHGGHPDCQLTTAQSLRLQATKTRWTGAWILEPTIQSTTGKPTGIRKYAK